MKQTKTIILTTWNPGLLPFQILASDGKVDTSGGKVDHNKNTIFFLFCCCSLGRTWLDPPHAVTKTRPSCGAALVSLKPT